MKSWAVRHPHPGKAPVKPPDEHPASGLPGWWAARLVWDTYVKQLRQHEIACAIDMLDRRVERGQLLEPEQIIARNLGACWLDGTLL